MKIAPSIKALVESGLCKDTETACTVRGVLLGAVSVRNNPQQFPRTIAWISLCHNTPCEKHVKLEAVNEILELHGVETVHAEDDGMFGQGSVAFEYLNAGDTYATTIIRRGKDNYRLTTMGDEIERLERKGVAVK